MSEIPGTMRHRRQQLKSGLGAAIFGLGAHRLMLRETAAIAVFHRVDDRLKGNPIACPVDEFRGYCDFFARHFNVVPLSELVSRVRNGERLNRCLSITFDDGYLDNYERAAPELEARGLPATFFIATGMIGSTTQPWWDREYGCKAEWMSWDQVRELHKRGFEMGAHTVNHVDLGQVHGAEAEREIVESKDRLESELGARVTQFSYPYGRLDTITAANRDVVRRAGFDCCFSAYGGAIARGADVFNLQRAPVTTWHVSPQHFGFELASRR